MSKASLRRWIQMPITGMKHRIALMGGSFDPPHIGHIHLMHEVATRTPITSLLLIPANVSNFKQDSSPASFENRLEMLSLAVEDFHELYPSDDLDVDISRWEGEKGGVSYTSETIRHFFSFYAYDGKVDFIIGDDILPSLEKWHDYSYIKNHVRFWCFSRKGSVVPPESSEIHMVESSIIEASSTEIREGSVEMLSKRVKAYIDERGLYRT